MLRYIKKRILKYKEKQIKDDFRTLKIEIQNYELLKPSVWQRIFKCLKKLYEMYPEIELGILNLIEVKNDIKHYNKAASTGFHFEKFEYVDTRQICIILNKDFFEDDSYFKDTVAYTDADISINDSVEWIISHEFGHLIDIVCSLKDEKVNRLMNVENVDCFLKNLTCSNEILAKIFQNYNEIESNAEILKMSRYAGRNNQEAFAEAVACNYFNSNNELAKKILNEFQKRREKK